MTVTPNKVVRQRIAEIMLETNDPHLFSIAVRAVPQADASLAFQQTNELIEVLRRDHGQESWSLDLVFESLCDTFPNRCAGFFAEFLHSATTQEAIELCFALRYTDTDVPVGSILAPLLKDERTTDYWSEPVRLRDFAARQA